MNENTFPEMLTIAKTAERSGLRDMLELLEARHLLQIVEERGKSAVIFLNPNYTP